MNQTESAGGNQGRDGRSCSRYRRCILIQGVNINIFVSWSGEPSKAAASALKVWLPKVLQGTQPWMSDVDIEAGANWNNQIAEKLNDCSVGIICVTPENQSRVWINFEAGAISKAASIGATRVIPLLIGFTNKTDLKGPLSMFQAVLADKDGLMRVLSTINNARGEQAISGPAVVEALDVWWPKLAESLDQIDPSDSHSGESARTELDLITEVLQLVRGLTRASSNQFDDSERISEDTKMIARNIAAGMRKRLRGQLFFDEAPWSLVLLNDSHFYLDFHIPSDESMKYKSEIEKIAGELSDRHDWYLTGWSDTPKGVRLEFRDVPF